jgi:serine/threonine protein kinase
VRVLECGTIDATSTGDGEGAVGFIAFERVQGTPLAALIAAECDLDPDELANEFLDIARGLDSMHHRGIVHGDISPANLLLGDDGKLRLIDFGNGVQHGSASAQRDSQQLAMCIVAAALGHIPSAGRLDAWLRLDVAGALARSATRAVGRDMDAAALADAVAGEVAATRRWRVVVGAAVTIIVFGGMLLAAEVAAM